MKTTVEVTDHFVIIAQGGSQVRFPRAFLIDLVEALINDSADGEIVYYYQNYGVAFSNRSCRLIVSYKAGVPEAIVTLQRNTVPKLVEGLYSSIESTYLGQTEIQKITSYLSRS